MQLLVVHHDAEVGEQLGKMVSGYTAHHCDVVPDDAAAMRWAGEHKRCRLLIAQLEGPGINGLNLAGSLSEVFPGLQTFFLPQYPAEEERFKIVETKIFPEPIDGERLVAAMEGAAAPNATPLDLFEPSDVLQMCCLSRRSGAVQMVSGAKSGIVFLRAGRIVHAKTAHAQSTAAMREIITWPWVEFAYDPYLDSADTIPTPWDETLSTALGDDDREISPPKPAPSGRTTPPAPPKLPKRGLFGAFRKN